MAALTTGQKADFINMIGPIIQTHAMASGYRVASPIIAQACLESRYGDSELARKYHNYFGMKCGSAWRGRSVNMKTHEEYRQGVISTIRDNFRAYDSMEEGVKGYFEFVSAKRYSSLRAAPTPKEYLERIKAAGYATASSYVKSNMAVVESMGLTRFDGFAISRANPYPEPTESVGQGSCGAQVRWVQYQLNLHGAVLAVDGMAGPKTISALRAFQSKAGLAADGICGRLTRNELEKST